MGELAADLGAWLERRAPSGDPYGFLLCAAAGSVQWRRAKAELVEPLVELLELPSVQGAGRSELVAAHRQADSERCRRLSGTSSKAQQELWAAANAKCLECAKRKYELLGRYLRVQSKRGQQSRLPAALRRSLSSSGECSTRASEEEACEPDTQHESEVGACGPETQPEREETQPEREEEACEPESQPELFRADDVVVTRYFWSHDRQRVLLRLSTGETLEAERERVDEAGFVEGYFELWGGWFATDYKASEKLTGEPVIQPKRPREPKEGRELRPQAAPEQESGQSMKAKKAEYLEGVWFWEHVPSRYLAQAMCAERRKGASQKVCRAFSYSKYGGAAGAGEAAEAFCDSFDPQG